MGEVAEWTNAATFFFLKVLTPVSRRRGFRIPPLSASRQRFRQRAAFRELEQVLRRHGP